MTTIDHSSQNNSDMQENNFCKKPSLFIGGLKPFITKENLQDYYEQYGEIAKIKMKFNTRTLANKGYAFIFFVENAVLDKVLSEVHSFGGRSVECKITYGGEFNRLDRIEAARSKIFVRNLLKTTTSRVLEEYWIKYGPIKHAYVIFEPDSQVSRCIGIIHYTNSASTAAALKGETVSPHKFFKCEKFFLSGNKNNKVTKNCSKENLIFNPMAEPYQPGTNKVCQEKNLNAMMQCMNPSIQNNYNMCNQNQMSNTNGYYNNQAVNQYYQTQMIQQMFDSQNGFAAQQGYNQKNSHFNESSTASNSPVLQESRTNNAQNTNYMPRNDNIKNFSDRLNEVKFDDFLSKVSNRNENEQKENAFQCGIFYDPYLMNGKNKQNKPIYKDFNNFKLLNEDDNLHKQKFNNFESENTCQEDDVMQKMSDRFDSLFFDEDTQFA